MTKVKHRGNTGKVTQPLGRDVNPNKLTKPLYFLPQGHRGVRPPEREGADLSETCSWVSFLSLCNRMDT